MTIKQVSTKIKTDSLFSDASARLFWNLLGEALQRGERVAATFKGLKTELDPHTLAFIGKDEKNNPTFGVGDRTKLAVEMVLDVALPIPDVEAMETKTLPPTAPTASDAAT